MAFAGTMRTNLIANLDGIGVAERLDLPTTAAQFDHASDQLHSSSALRGIAPIVHVVLVTCVAE